MTTKDINSYINCSYKDDLEKISELSKFVDDDREIYNYDKITQKLYDNKNYPTSADSILISEKQIAFIEYKSGFKRKIDFRKLDLSKLTCPTEPNKTCKDYGKLQQKIQKLERSELLDSIRLKAVESFITLDKKIFPLCQNTVPTRNIKIQFCVVIDDYVESMEETLLELANEEIETNSMQLIKDSLSRLKCHLSSDNIPYYYDDIYVFSPHELKRYLDTVLSIT